MWQLFLLITLICLPIRPTNAQNAPGELLRNGSLEGGGGPDGKGGGVPEWLPFGQGYDIDRQTHHAGDQAIRCDSLNMKQARGAQLHVTLNQQRAVPIVVSAWSKADQVQGTTAADYALYIDAEYMDGTPLWGSVAPFRPGTHDWQRRQVTLLPAKPLRSLTVIALFRYHTGTAWFDDLSAHSIETEGEKGGGHNFDAQPLKLLAPVTAPGPRLHVTGPDKLALDIDPKGGIPEVRLNRQAVGSGTGGFYLRDVGKDGPLIAVRGQAQPSKTGGINIGANVPNVRIAFNAKLFQSGDSIQIDGEMTDLTQTDRAITVYFALPVDATGWQWGDDIRHTETIIGSREYTHQTHVNLGATGGLSLYPYASVANAQGGIGIASQMDWPSVFRLFYNGPTRQFVIAWDVALTGKTAAWPAHNTRFRANLFAVPGGPPEWSFRQATRRFYALNAPGFKRRAMADGGWLPFADPTKIEKIADFGFAYHEGDNSVKADDALGLLSFHYTEPMTYWLPMPPTMPRTYENALALIQRQANSREPETKTTAHPTPFEWAQAVLNSGTQDPEGHFNLEFQNAPWANGAVFVLNPNPELPATADKPTRASIAYTLAKAAKTYDHPSPQQGQLDGEYLDSLEGWADTLDYRPSDLASSPYPLPFDVDDHLPVLPSWYSTHAFTRFLSQDLHNRDRLLMANSVPVRFSIYAPLLDVMGIEVNWLSSKGEWRPDSDETFNFRRTLSGKKPYLLLMNTDYDRFTPPLVEKYFQRCLFYAVFPGMFSANAADNPYWETPRWYNRDRPLFKKYLPLIKQLSAAGWEPIPYARSNTPSITVERYGDHLFTVQNMGQQPTEGTITIDLKALNLPAMAPKPFKAIDQIAAMPVAARQETTNLILTLKLAPDQVTLLEISQ